jgi:ferredoxin-NADP reductase
MRTGDDVEFEVVVSDYAKVADDVVALVFARPDGSDLPTWQAGAHVDVVLKAGLVRQFSLCGPASNSAAFRVAVLREPAGRGGSAYVHDVVRRGDVLHLRGPRNHFALVPSPRYQFIAGGIGITPILAMIAQAEAAGAEWRLLYGGRTRASMAFVDELAPFGDQVALAPQDECGLLDLAAVLDVPRDDTLVYCCGPEALLVAVEERMAAWRHGALHVERFAPKPDAVTTPKESDSEFDVVLARSGRTVHVAHDKTIVEALAEAGVTVPTSCTEGVCGTCETAVIAGVPEHRDSLLTEDERAANDTMLVCVSRACGASLTLDL